MDEDKISVDEPIFYVKKGVPHEGHFTINKTGIGFTHEKNGEKESFYRRTITSYQVLRVARGYQLRCVLLAGTLTFDGFRSSTIERVKTFLKETEASKGSGQDKAKVRELKASYSGGNEGKHKFSHNFLRFSMGDKVAFEVPLGAVNNAFSDRYEAVLEFNDTAVEARDQTVESMRFVVIPEEETQKYAPAADFAEVVREKAHIDENLGNAVCNLGSLSLMTPRGRYEIEFHEDVLHMRGKTYNNRIEYDKIRHIFALPRPDESVLVVIMLDPPLTQGQSHYYHLVIQFKPEDDDPNNREDIEISVAQDSVREKLSYLAVSDDADIAYDSGPTNEILQRLLKAFTKKEPRKPLSYTSKEGYHCIGCTVKSDRGFLFPLEKGFMFVHKPVIHIPFKDIREVEFERVEGSKSRSTSTFDMVVRRRSNADVEFRNINRDELDKLLEFLQMKSVHIKELAASVAKGAISMAEDGDDDEFGDSEDDGDFRGSNDSESEDESFAGSAEESSEVGSSGEESMSVDETFLEDAGIKPKTKKKTKKSKSSSRGGDDDGEDDDEDGDASDSEKPKKKKKSSLKKKGTKGDGSAKKSKSKGKKDPNAPKRPQTSYLFFANEKRPAIKEAEPSLSLGDIGKKLGELWRGLSSEDKAPYEEKAAEDKKRYEREMAAYKAKKGNDDDGDDDEDDGSRKRKPKAKKAPSKKPKETKKHESAEWVESSDSE